MRLRGLGPTLSLAFVTSACGILLGASDDGALPPRGDDGGSVTPIDGSAADGDVDANPDAGSDGPAADVDAAPVPRFYTWSFDSPPSNDVSASFGFDSLPGSGGQLLIDTAEYVSATASLDIQSPTAMGQKDVGVAAKLHASFQIAVDKSPIATPPQVFALTCGIQPIGSIRLNTNRTLVVVDDGQVGSGQSQPTATLPVSFDRVVVDATIGSTTHELSVTYGGAPIKLPITTFSACTGQHLVFRIGLVWLTNPPAAGVVRAHLDDIDVAVTPP